MSAYQRASPAPYIRAVAKGCRSHAAAQRKDAQPGQFPGFVSWHPAGQTNFSLRAAKDTIRRSSQPCLQRWMLVEP